MSVVIIRLERTIYISNAPKELRRENDVLPIAVVVNGGEVLEPMIMVSQRLGRTLIHTVVMSAFMLSAHPLADVLPRRMPFDLGEFD